MTRARIRYVGFVGGTGGASALMRACAPRLRARGVPVEVVVPSGDGRAGLAERLRADGVPTTLSPLLRGGGGPLRDAAAAAAAVARYGGDGALVHWHLTDNALSHHYLRALRLLRPPPGVATIHNPHAGLAPGDPWARRWAAAVPGRVAEVHCVSEDSRRHQLALGVPPAAARLVRNGVDLARSGAGDGPAARRAIGLGADAPLVVMVARLEPGKRPLDALEAFARAAAERPDAALAFVGVGPLESRLRARAAELGLAERVHLLGFRDDVADWLAAATAYVLPTESEGLSLALLEAMAAGCAIVSTRCAGVTELLADGTTACLTPVGDVAAQAGALRRLLADPALRRRLGAAAREAAAAYSVERTVDEQLASYERVLGARRGQSG